MSGSPHARKKIIYHKQKNSTTRGAGKIQTIPRIQSDLRKRTLLDFTTCLVMYGNGILLLLTARIAAFVAALGSMTLFIVGLLCAFGSIRPFATSLSGSAWPGPNTLSFYPLTL